MSCLNMNGPEGQGGAEDDVCGSHCNGDKHKTKRPTCSMSAFDACLTRQSETANPRRMGSSARVATNGISNDEGS